MNDRDEKPTSGGHQIQESRQSGRQGVSQQGPAAEPREQQPRSGIGASQGQDRASRDEPQSDRPSAGTPDIERSSSSPESMRPAGNSEESLVQESTGAFKERP
jgi:hypothetical protein